MRSHLFSPRSPARFMGYRMRSGWNSTCLKARQRGHSAPRLYGSSGSPSHLMKRPVSGSEYTRTPHPSWQPGADHTEVRVTSMPSSMYCHSPGCFQSCISGRSPAPKLNWFSSFVVPMSSRSFSRIASCLRSASFGSPAPLKCHSESSRWAAALLSVSNSSIASPLAF